MSRLTKLDNDITKVKGTYMPYDERKIITLCDSTYIQALLNKLGQLEDLIEKYAIPDIEYLEKCIIAHDKLGEMRERVAKRMMEAKTFMVSQKPCSLEDLYNTTQIIVPELSEEDKEKFLKDLQNRKSIILKDNNCKIDYVDTDMLLKDFKKRKEEEKKNECIYKCSDEK